MFARSAPLELDGISVEILDGQIVAGVLWHRHLEKNHIYLLPLSDLLSALRANDSDTCRRCLSGGIQDLGRPAVEELMLK